MPVRPVFGSLIIYFVLLGSAIDEVLLFIELSFYSAVVVDLILISDAVSFFFFFGHEVEQRKEGWKRASSRRSVLVF